MAKWRYKLEEKFVFHSPLLRRISFVNEWVTIRNGSITIAKDYSWDGCSPSFYIKPFGKWIGTPDGKPGIDGMPSSYWASLVHDALCQFRDQIYIPKNVTVALFRVMLMCAGAPKWMTRYYPMAVNLFGPQAWLGYEQTAQI